MKAPVFDPNWSDEVRRLHQHDMQEIWDAGIAPQVYRQYHYQLDFYHSLVPQNRALHILDVGCAQATLALLLAERGHQVTAVDIRPDFLAYAASRHTHGEIRFVAGNLFEQEVVQGQFDLVFANQIIEHVLDPEHKIRALARYLAPRGRLVMTTPNGRYLRGGLPSYGEFIASGRAFTENTADGDGHVFAFTREELCGYVASAGLRVLQSGWMETPFVNGHLKFRYLMGLLPLGLSKRADSLLRALPGLGEKLSHQLFVIAAHGAPPDVANS